MSQRVFAELLDVSFSTVRSWEQGWRAPDGAALRLLSIAEESPGVLMKALAQPTQLRDERVSAAG